MALGRKTGGRQKGTPNKATARLKEYAQQFDEESIDFLVAVMRNKRTVEVNGVAVTEDLGADYRERVEAAKELLKRGHGMPAQEVTADVDHGELVIRWAEE